MLTDFKRFFRFLLGKLGYQIIRVHAQDTPSPVENQIKLPENHGLIKEIEYLYRYFLFKKLPPHEDTRIRLMSQLLGTSVSEAIYILNYLYQSLSLEGDICEFGVAQGTTSALIAHEIRKTRKNIWLFDSFQGLPKPSEKDILKDDFANLGSIEAYEGMMACDIEMVKERLAKIHFPFDRVRIVPGFIEETIHSLQIPDKVCFAYVDFDFYEPTVTVLTFLDDTLQKHGVIIVDDYDFFSTGVKTAVDNFVATHGDKYTFSFPISPGRDFCILEKNE